MELRNATWLELFCNFSKTLSWWASYSSRQGYSLDMRRSKLGSGRSDRFETNFFRQVGHSLLPDLSAVMIQSEQNLCKHSLVVIVFFNISRHIGHISSLWRLLGDTAISVLSVIASWGVLFSSYNDNSHVLFNPICSADAIIGSLFRSKILASRGLQTPSPSDFCENKYTRTV